MITLWKLAPALIHLPLEPGLSSLNDVSAHLPQGVYTTLRTYHHYPFELKSHLNRLEESAMLVGKSIKLDHGAIQTGIDTALQEFPGEARLRLTLDLAQHPGEVYLTVETLRLPPPEAYREGVQVVTYHLERRDPLAKKTDFITVAEHVRHGVPYPVEEVVMVTRAGLIVEGLTSNFFAVKDGTLYTAGEGVLAGITRSLVIDLAMRTGIPLRQQAISLSKISSLAEAFLTSSSRSILPIRQIDDFIFQGQIPGAITQRLMEMFEDEINRRQTSNHIWHSE